MQFNGIGSDHVREMHHVTSCVHEHAHMRKDAGGADMAPRPAQEEAPRQGQEGQFSLAEWMEKVWGNGKRLLRGIWGTQGTVAGEAGDGAGAAEPPVCAREGGSGSAGAGASGNDSSRLHIPQIALAATAVQQPDPARHTPYYSAIQDTGREQENLWQKVRVKFKNIAGQLAGHLPGNFFRFQGKNSFQSRQGAPKEEPRPSARRRRDRVELNSYHTEESYLLDSYDRKGEYSRLSTKK